MKNKLQPVTRLLILQGVKQAGSYEPDEALVTVEENMTPPEYAKVFAFLTWVSKTGRKFGPGNIDEVFEEWRYSE